MRMHLMEYGLNEEEAIIFEWQFHRLGGFETALMEAIARADHTNMGLLKLGFPTHVSAFKGYTETEAFVMRMNVKMAEFPAAKFPGMHLHL